MYHISLSIKGALDNENMCTLRVGDEFFTLTTTASIDEIKSIANDTNVIFYKSHFMKPTTTLQDIGDGITEKELFLLIWGLALNRRHRAKNATSSGVNATLGNTNPRTGKSWLQAH